eukprot:TRINITY_DN20745_c0_g1_i1.p1 TRINITY_DN20745_c0_g1~~TRINITY_DN20745_c0_g1_i1.p1  ORF type:complete len:390 (-),score=77.64 TRINITY_DN20745_c0_g1_i1:84-1253(-)
MAAAAKHGTVVASSYDRIAVLALLSLLSLGPFLWVMDTMSLQYSKDDAAATLWWITWASLLPIGVWCILKAGEASTSVVKPVLGMVCVASMFGLLMSFMWLRASFSFAHLAENGAAEEVNVALDKLPVMEAKGDVASVALEAGQGFVQPTTVFQVHNFSYGCHGHMASSLCRTSVSSGGPRKACQHLEFPDECPGAELLMITPVWYDSSSVAGRPYALALQSRTFLFNNESGRGAWAAKHQTPEFKSELCRNERFCAFLLSNAHVEAHWIEWHSEHSAADVAQDGVGKHSYTVLSYKGSIERAKTLAKTQMQQLNMAGDYLPLLWVPGETSKSFQLWENNLQQSESLGRVGFIILIVFAANFILISLAFFGYGLQKNAAAAAETTEASV